MEVAPRSMLLTLLTLCQLLFLWFIYLFFAKNEDDVAFLPALIKLFHCLSLYSSHMRAEYNSQ